MEQCYAWAKDQFDAFLIGYPATAEAVDGSEYIYDPNGNQIFP